MKTNVKKLLAIFLCAVMAFGAVLPAFAADAPEIKPTWQDTVESVTPVGKEPYAGLKLTPKQYVFTDWDVPTEYDITMKDGSVRRVTVDVNDPYSRDYVEGMFAGYRFSVDAGDGTLTFYAAVRFDRDTKQCAFEIGQWVPEPMLETEGPYGIVCTAAPISSEPCEFEIDEGSFIVRILYRLYTVWQKVENWFVLHFGKK